MKKVMIISVYFFVQAAIGQTQSGDLKAYLNGYIDNLPGSSGNQFRIPSESEFDQFKQGITEFLNGELGSARSSLSNVNYEIIEFSDPELDSERVYYVITEKSPQAYYGGIFVFTETLCDQYFSIQAPHPIFDTNTGLQAIHGFLRMNSGSLMIAGTHRCNNSTASSCSGTTSACGASEAYRMSDMAHTPESFFHATTEALAEYDNTVPFIQLHGFGKESSDPYLILSNGTRYTPENDYLVALDSELKAIDPVLDSETAHLNFSWSRLIGFTNVQGRFLNGSSNPCSSTASSSEGRFLHVEQERSRLRADASGWEKMALAMGRTFGCDYLILGAETKSFGIYPNPGTGQFTFTGLIPKHIRVVNISGELVHADILPNQSLNLSSLRPGIYFLVPDHDSSKSIRIRIK